MTRRPRLRLAHCPQGIVALGFLGCLSGACSWWRYDDVTEKTPVLLLEAPGGTHSMGKSVAAITGKAGTAQVFALGRESYVLYDLGKKDPATTDATEQGHCDVNDGCFGAESVAAIQREVKGVTLACFAYAVSQNANDNQRVQLHCDGAGTIGVGLDSATETALGKLTSSSTLQLRFASGPRSNPQRLVAAAADKSALFYYATPGSGAVAIALPNGVNDSFGRSLALLDLPFYSTAIGATVVIGEPTANRVHFLAVDDSGAVTATACLEGPSAFGSVLTTGYFLDPTRQGLAVGSLSQLWVISDMTRLAQAASQGEGCLTLGDLTNVQTLACKNFGLNVDCASALTRGAMAPADLDDDGVDELIVGVPTAFSSGNRAAGQLLTISVTSNGLSVLERRSPSSAESGDRLGESVVAVPLSRPDVVLAGAPGGNKLAAFYCSVLLPAGLGGKRCE